MLNEQLVQLYQAGDKQALDDLIEQNKGIVYKLVNKFYIEGTNSIDRDDLMQEGFIGLMAAANKYKFDIDHPCKFSTYAVYWIYQKINRFVKFKNTNEEVSLNEPVSEEGGTELLDYIEGADYSFENVEEKIYRQQLRKELGEVMLERNTLREREILKLHYGWDNNKYMTYESIGELFKVTGSRVRQIERMALRKIRQSNWSRHKAKEFYNVKKNKSIYSIPGTVDAIDFMDKYLVE
jgi:RNA polymerase primary sigma factor/RNA polymerase sporulation-specific sigma factor